MGRTIFLHIGYPKTATSSIQWFLHANPQEDIHYHVIQCQSDTLAANETMNILMQVDAL